MGLGTVADWVAAIGTVGTLAVALAIMAVDRRDHNREQADRIVLWPTFHSTRDESGELTRGTRLMIRNGSDQPIVNVRAYYRPRSQGSVLARRLLGQRLDTSTIPTGLVVVSTGDQSAVIPAATAVAPIPIDVDRVAASEITVAFTDYRGRRRVKEVSLGRPNRYRLGRSAEGRNLRHFRTHKGEATAVDTPPDRLP